MWLHSVASAVIWGAHAASRAGFGGLAETIFLQKSAMDRKEKVRDDGDVIASTRGACAPQNAMRQLLNEK
jgi:hypothetical protein